MLAIRKFGSFLALGVLLPAMAGTSCLLLAQQMNPKQMACCASGFCQHSAKTADCCTHLTADRQQFRAALAQPLRAPHLVLAMPVITVSPATPESSAFVEIAQVEHAPPRPLYTIHHSFLI